MRSAWKSLSLVCQRRLSHSQPTSEMRPSEVDASALDSKAPDTGIPAWGSRHSRKHFIPTPLQPVAVINSDPTRSFRRPRIAAVPVRPRLATSAKTVCTSSRVSDSRCQSLVKHLCHVARPEDSSEIYQSASRRSRQDAIDLPFDGCGQVDRTVNLDSRKVMSRSGVNRYNGQFPARHIRHPGELGGRLMRNRGVGQDRHSCL